MNKETIIKQLITQARKYGYLTFSDINRTFSEQQFSSEEMDSFMETLAEIGVKIIEVEKQRTTVREIEISDDIVQEEPLRVFLDEVSRIESIDRKTELAIAKNIRLNERKLLSIVLSSTIALRELNNWVTLLEQNEMTPKELMKRGRKSKRSLMKMRQRIAAAIKRINATARRVDALQRSSRNTSLSSRRRTAIEDRINRLKQDIVDEINRLDLNTEKVKRLVKRAQSITDKALQVYQEVRKYEELFGRGYESVMRLYRRAKERKMSPVEFRRVTGYSVSAAETMLENFQRVMERMQQITAELKMTPDEITDLSSRINELVQVIEEDKMRLIKANLSLVVTFARKFSMLTGVDVDDLIQEGATGLSKAVEKFEWRKGYKFSTYAHWWVRQAISRYMADYVKTIRLPVHIRELVSKMIKVYKKFRNQNTREITIDDYSKALRIQPKKIIDTLSVLADPLSFHTPVGKDEEATIQDFVRGPDDEVPLHSIMVNYKRQVIDDAMGVLDEREREILKLRYGFTDGKEYTLEEVGRLFSITRERVRQIEAKAIRRLRNPEILGKLREVYPVKD
jgi:RNA polymerase primary sigma factor